MGHRPRRRTRPARLASVGVLCSLLLTACGGGSTPSGSGTRLLIVVNAPLSVSPSIGRWIYQGVKLAADQQNTAGGVSVAGRRYTFAVEQLDNALSPQKALDNVRQAVQQHAVAIVDEGTGLDA